MCTSLLIDILAPLFPSADQAEIEAFQERGVKPWLIGSQIDGWRDVEAVSPIELPGHFLECLSMFQLYILSCIIQVIVDHLVNHNVTKLVGGVSVKVGNLDRFDGAELIIHV